MTHSIRKCKVFQNFLHNEWLGLYIFFFFSAAETWPFLISLLINCASSEIFSSKRRLPKLIYAKTLRIVVQRAHDSKLSGIY